MFRDGLFIQNWLKTIFASLVLGLVIWVIHAAPPAAASGQAIPAQTGSSLTYEGTAVMNVELVDVYGRSRGQQTYTTDVVISIGNPNPNETNPFQLIINPKVIANNPGEFSIYSSAIYNNEVTFQYWQYKYYNNGTIEGVLTDHHVAESIALNLFTIPQELYPNYWTTFPEAMKNGTQLSGNITNKEVKMVIVGDSTSLVYPFTINIEAVRVR